MNDANNTNDMTNAFGMGCNVEAVDIFPGSNIWINNTMYTVTGRYIIGAYPKFRVAFKLVDMMGKETEAAFRPERHVVVLHLAEAPVAVLDDVPEGAEVYEMMASTPEVANTLGRSRAESLSRRGYRTVCVGVVPYKTRTVFEGVTVPSEGFRPVLAGLE